jgi:hypothetical protein
LPAVIDMRWQRVGRLLVLHQQGQEPISRAALWLCRCDCGSTALVTGSALRKANTKSCGCLRRDLGRIKTLTHGQSRRGQWSQTYRTWANMHWRVKSSSARNAPYYRDRGITVCARWTSFELFLADMGPRPFGKSLDRINNDLGYGPNNCRWATAQQQSQNRRPRRRLKK